MSQKLPPLPSDPLPPRALPAARVLPQGAGVAEALPPARAARLRARRAGP